MVDEAVQAELAAAFHLEQARHTRDNTRTRISGIGGCRRQIAYRRLWHAEGKAEPPLSAHLLSIFATGHALHLNIQHRLSNAGVLKWVDADPIVDKYGNFGWAGDCEINLKSEEHEIEGHCDALTRPLKRVDYPLLGAAPGLRGMEMATFLEPCLEDDPRGRRYIIDIKTITARERAVPNAKTGEIVIKPSPFEKLKKPKDEHIQQVSLYAWLTTQPGFQTDRIKAPLARMPALMVVYVAKDLVPDYYERHPEAYQDPASLLNAPFKVFTVEPDMRVIEALLAKNRAISTHVKAGTLPPRDFNHTPQSPAYACMDCGFRQACYAREGFFAETPGLPPRVAYRLRQAVAGGMDTPAPA